MIATKIVCMLAIGVATVFAQDVIKKNPSQNFTLSSISSYQGVILELWSEKIAAPNLKTEYRLAGNLYVNGEYLFS